jgi:hypothetical protein
VSLGSGSRKLAETMLIDEMATKKNSDFFIDDAPFEQTFYRKKNKWQIELLNKSGEKNGPDYT